MAKVQQKSEKITAFGGIFFVLDKFDSILSSVIDSHLGLRSTLIGYQYSEIIRAIFSVFCCGGDCMEDLNLYLKDVLTERAASKTYKAMGKTMDESYEQMLQQLSNEGCTVRRLTHEEVSDFVTNVRQSEVQERWVKEKESEGTADVRRVFEKLRSLVQHSAKRKQ